MSNRTIHSATEKPVYQRIRTLVHQIPPGTVATYGQIAAIAGDCTARMVGYAMAGLPPDSDVPWQRVINAQGKISPRGDPLSSERQRRRLAEEGVRFDADGRIDLRRYRWSGPDWTWLAENGLDPMAVHRTDDSLGK